MNKFAQYYIEQYAMVELELLSNECHAQGVL